MRTPLNHLLLGAGLLGAAALSHGAFASSAGIVSPAADTDETTAARYDIDVIHPEADSFAAFEGRTILVEFFAHW